MQQAQELVEIATGFLSTHALAMGWALHLTCFTLVVLHCLQARREPSTTILWIAVAWSFPVIGPLLYVSFGVDRIPAKGWIKREHDEQFLAERRAREDESLPLAYWRAVYEMVAAQPRTEIEKQLGRAISSMQAEFPLLGGNDVQPLVSGSEAFPEMLRAIRAAHHHVHMQTFILGRDAVAREFLDALAERARAGVKVRILYDRFGSTRALLSGFFLRYKRVPNMQLVGWTQANPLKRQFQVNLRNHRKALIVDGTTAFCGGINIHDQATKGGEIRDYHFRVRGPIVLELQYTFLRDWNFMTDEGPDELLRDCYFPRPHAAGRAVARLVNGGPSVGVDALWDTFFLAVTLARRQILLVTPYFVPAPDLLRALRGAALRGVDVRLVVPRRTNHLCAGLAAEALYEELADAGVRIYRRLRPFMHAKACIVDDTVALVGTANMDVRSLRLNYETNLAIYDTDVIGQLKRIVCEDEARSEELDILAWRGRSALRRLAENAASLLAPVL
jgi:cardiolipin synthase